MYGFVDTVPDSGEIKRNMSIQTTFNGFNIDEELSDENGSFLTLTVTGRANQSVRRRMVSVANMHGAWEENEGYREPREILVKFKIKDDTNEGLRDRFNRLKSLLEGSKRELFFNDENAIFYASLLDLEVPEEEGNELIGTIRFLCSDPSKYGEEKEYSFPIIDILQVENEGNAEADPIFELIARRNLTFAMVSNQDNEYNLIGVPADDDVQEVDTRTSVLYENGSTLDQWQDASLDMVDRLIDRLDGTMGTDGAGIRPNPYGTSGNQQRGAGITRELPEAIQDFELETTFDIISRRERENWRMVIYLHDENLNNIGHLGLKDNSVNYKRRRALGRVGGWHRDYAEGHYILGDNTYSNDNARDTTLFYLRMKREGNRFSFYVGEWQSFRHINIWEGSYNDVNNEWMGKVKYVTLFIGSFQDRPIPSRLRVNSLELFELSQVTVDQTPYILREGDVVEFDHRNDDILVNGEPRNDLKNFGGSFFKLKKGLNRLLITPEEGFYGTLRYRNKFL